MLLDTAILGDDTRLMNVDNIGTSLSAVHLLDIFDVLWLNLRMIQEGEGSR